MFFYWLVFLNIIVTGLNVSEFNQMYEVLGWPLSDPVVGETHGASRERQTSRVVCVGWQFKVRRLRQTCPCMGRTPCFRSNWVFREVTPVI